MKHNVIYGPPGTGKTRTLIGEVQLHLKLLPENRALFCSHTKAAAATAVSRWGKESGRLEISTIHSHCFKSLGLSMAQTVDDAKLGFFVQQFGMSLEDGSDANAYLEIIDLAANLDIPDSESYNRSDRPGTMGHFLAFASSYKSWKKQFGYVDFTGMLTQYVERHRRGTGHTMLAIDEAQDLTPLHWRVVDQYMENNPKCAVTVAGDDDQCIYGHTGAVALGAYDFARKHDALEKILGQSYRVPRRIHALAAAIGDKLTKRVPKEYLPRSEEGLVQAWGDFQWGHSVGRSDRDTLILYSDRFIRKELVEPQLQDRGVPYTALSGYPAPLDTRAGKALQVAFKRDHLTDDDFGAVRRALSDYGKQIYDTVGAEPVIEKLRKFDFKLLQKVHWTAEDYFRRLDWRLPTNIKISTIHGAKGMEAADVHLVTGQSPRAVNQALSNPDGQHRLFYVGVTRASERLFTYSGDNAYELPRAG